MTSFIKKHRLLVGIVIAIFNFSAIVVIFYYFSLSLWTLRVKQPAEKDIVNYINNTGCELTKVEDEAEIYEFLYYEKESSCNYDIVFGKTYYPDVINDYIEEFGLDTNYNKTVNDYWDFSSHQYQYYGELGDYYRVVTNIDYTILSIEGKAENRGKIDKIFKDLQLEYKYKNMTNFGDDMIILFIVMILYFWWQIYVKFGRKGWIVFIPIYNLICLSDDVFKNKGMVVLCFFPIINIIYYLLVFWNLGKYYNKGKKYCLLTMLLPCIFIPLLVFSNSSFNNEKAPI